MRAERCVGRAVRRLVEMGVPREGLLIASKGGYITHDCEDSRTREDYLRQEYLETGLIDESEMKRSHSIRASFIEEQLQRSLDNLGLESIDVYFVHNPEVGIADLGHDTVIERLRQTFVILENAVARGNIGCYGVATWEGLRVVPDDPRHLSLTRVLRAAAEAAKSCGAKQHHLRAVQLPLNIRDHQSSTVASQPVGSQLMSAVQAVRAHGLYCFTSASVLQGRKVPREQATELSETMGGMTVSTAALQAVRSTVGVGSALVGMRRIASVEESITLASLAPTIAFKGLEGPPHVSSNNDRDAAAYDVADLAGLCI
jgi:aryl-alcohol dehydrogenase-like predicted oxidoreductase